VAQTRARTRTQAPLGQAQPCRRTTAAPSSAQRTTLGQETKHWGRLALIGAGY